MAPHIDSAGGVRAHRGAILHFRSDPGSGDDPDSFEFFDDGLLVTADGRVAS
ncbi:MAG: guanine deaminase, partial [Gammaproteobacteria bacterium]